MLTKFLREIFDFKSNEIENKSNLSKEILDKISFIFEKLDNIYKLEQKDYVCCGYVCSVTEKCGYMCSVIEKRGYIFNIKLQNINITLNKLHGKIDLFIDDVCYTLFKNKSNYDLLKDNTFIDNGILNKDEFILLVEKIYMVVVHFYKDYSYILESDYDYNFFEETAIKSREEARKDIVKFINNI